MLNVWACGNPETMEVGPQVQVLGVGANLSDCGCFTLGTVSGRWIHPGDSRQVTPSAETGRGLTLETVEL